MRSGSVGDRFFFVAVGERDANQPEQMFRLSTGRRDLRAKAREGRAKGKPATSENSEVRTGKEGTTSRN